MKPSLPLFLLLAATALLPGARAQSDAPSSVPSLPATTDDAPPTSPPASSAPLAAPAAPASVAPAQAAPPPAADIHVVFEAPIRVVERNVVGTSTLRRSLDLSQARVAALRAKGGFSSSVDADLKAFLASIPARPVETRFEEFTDGWALVQHDGYTVDADGARRALKAALTGNAAGGATVNIAVRPLTTTPPKRTIDFFVSKGITALLGSGETTYYGSSPARVTNIHVGARQFQDRLVSGKVFSFNDTVGLVSARNGFVPGLVIAGDRTATGVGGGICQVSTTVFRALYGAGLPIVERRNHSYQVHYYDPQGLDATIYQPSQDLRFQNTSGGALWFQADWDDEAHSLEVQVFGKPQEYTVEVGAPRVLASRPAPRDRLLSDPTLPVGRRVQVDWAAPGATIEVQRVLRQKDGSVLRRDTLRSSYRPWPNIFMVGTKR